MGEIEQGQYATLFGPEPLNLLGVVILTSLGTWGLPQMVHKFYAIKNTDGIRKGAVISTIFALVVAGGSYFMGGLLCSTLITLLFIPILYALFFKIKNN